MTNTKFNFFKNQFAVPTVLLRIFWTYQFPKTKNFLRMFSELLETPEIQNYSRKRKLKYLFSQIRFNSYIVLFSITLKPGRCLFVCLFFISLQINSCSALGNFNFHPSPQHNPLLQRYSKIFSFLSKSWNIRLYFDNPCGWISNSCQGTYQHLLFSFYQFVPSGLHSTVFKSRLNKITGHSEAISHYFLKHRAFFLSLKNQELCHSSSCR